MCQSAMPALWEEKQRVKVRGSSGTGKGATGTEEGRQTVGYVIQWRRSGLLCKGQLQKPAARPAGLGGGLLQAIWDILQAWTEACLNLLGPVSKAGIKPFCSTKAFH